MPGKKHLRGVGSKEQRQYEHIKKSVEQAGRYGGRAKEVAARTVMKEHKARQFLSRKFEEHLTQTKGHVHRLEEIFAMLNAKAGGKKCVGMEGLIQEGTELMGEDFQADVMDAALISAAQRVEHYEIAADGTVSAYADLLGESHQASLLRQTLEEERETDEKLTELSKHTNVTATFSAEHLGRKRRPGSAA